MAQNSNKNANSTSPPVKHSEPIPISAGSTPRRNRSASLSSTSSSSLSSVASDLATPVTPSSANPHHVNSPSPSTSPILSYFLAQSPTKASATFPFRSKIAGSPVFEEEEEQAEPPVAAHARRASTAAAGRFGTSTTNNSNVPPILSDPRSEKGTGLLRRLSLGGAAFAKPMTDTTAATRQPPTPVVPPNSAVDSAAPTPLPRNATRPRRSATMGPSAQRPRRAPSPMGERMLKGHFDGFN